MSYFTAGLETLKEQNARHTHYNYFGSSKQASYSRLNEQLTKTTTQGH